ncbi:LysR family transcriptional regulator [Pseudopelagicola sp. nBUS_20]|uniref:LysR family transcriptional regulator n=1 Tax=Pseudopelagicola sp. nBUS_20 TaxID=3395317 RepID=UPI003EBB4FFE
MTSIRQMQIFRSVARNLSYTRAAEELNLTQPAVFTQVRHLQENVGSPLIERIGKRLFLTEAGEVVLASAHDILGELERLDMRLAELRGMTRGRLRVCVVSTAKYDIPRRLGDFCRMYPGIDVSLTVGNREELLSRFAANEDDLYVLGTVPKGIEADWHQYAENPIVVIAAPDHPLAGKSKIKPSDIAGEAFIMREKGSGTRIATERFFSGEGISPTVRMELGANEAISEAVMARLGISVISRGSARLELQAGKLVELNVNGFPILRHWHVAWPKGKRISVGADAFLKILLEEI